MSSWWWCPWARIFWPGMWCHAVEFDDQSLCNCQPHSFSPIALVRFWMQRPVYPMYTVYSISPVFIAILSLRVQMKVEIFVGGKPAVLMLCLYNNLLLQLKLGPSQDRRAIEVGSSSRFGFLGRVEIPENFAVTVAILSESLTENVHLNMETV